MRRNEHSPRIGFENIDEWRALFAIAELLRTRGYQVDEYGSLNTSFREIHKIFLSGRKGISSDKTVNAFESLASRKFNLIFGKDSKNKTEKKDSYLFKYESDGDFRGIKRIHLNEIFYHNINGYYLLVPANFLNLLSESGKEFKSKIQLTASDIILFLYVHQLKNQTKRSEVQLKIEVIVEMLGLTKRINEGHKDRAIKTIEQSLNLLKNIRIVEEFYFYEKKIILIFKKK